MNFSFHDIRYAGRMIEKAPGLAFTSIFVLALGIGIPTIMFTIVNGVLRDLPVPEGERIVHVFRTDLSTGERVFRVSYPALVDWRAQQTTFEGLAGFATEDVTLSGNSVSALRRDAAYVTANTFDLLRIPPIIGRGFQTQDARPGAAPVVVISHAVWQERFSGDFEVPGRTLAVDGESHTVIGVMPREFGFPFGEDLWLPLQVGATGSGDEGPFVDVFGRLADAVPIEQARADMQTVVTRLAAARPEVDERFGADVRPYTESHLGEPVAAALWVMLGAVSLVLLLACANVSSLLLTRAVHRRTELAVRTALGAKGGRVVLQLLTEALVISAIGGALGLFGAWAGISIFSRAVASSVGFSWVDIRIDGVVLLFVAGIIVASAVVAGILPGLQAARTNISQALKDHGRSVSSGWLSRVHRLLVIGEVALSGALLIVSGLLVKSALEFRSVDLGMPVEEIMTGEVELPRQAYQTPESRTRFFEELEARVSALPGVVSVALMSDVPATGGFPWPIRPEGTSADPNMELPRVGGMTVTPSFLTVLDAAPVAGRGFDARDRAGAEPVLLVNQRFANRFFPDDRVVGRTVQLDTDPAASPWTIVGVVPDLYLTGLDDEQPNGPGFYLPLAQNPHVSMQVMVRTSGDPLRLTAAVGAALASIDPTIALTDVDRVDRLIQRELLAYDVLAALFLFFGATALLLAAVGLYGVMAFAVSLRTREWGMRMALGAQGRDVLRLVLYRGAWQLGIGLFIGLALGGLLSVVVAGINGRIEAWDPAVLTVVATVLALTGLAATLIPALRATRIDPLEALRQD
jgi:putative ABC transport system permease protein